MVIIPAVVVPEHPEIPRELYNQCIGCHRGRTLAIFHRKGRNPRQLYLGNVALMVQLSLLSTLTFLDVFSCLGVVLQNHSNVHIYNNQETERIINYQETK